MSLLTFITAILVTSSWPVCLLSELPPTYVSSTGELLEALRDERVNSIRLTGGLNIDPVVYNQLIGQNATIQLDRNVTIFGGEGGQGIESVVLSFSNIPAAITVRSNRELAFRDVAIRGVSSRYNPDMAGRTHLVNAGLGVWPAIVMEPESVLCLNQTLYEFIGINCSYDKMANRAKLIDALFGNTNTSEFTAEGLLHLQGELLVIMPVRKYQPEAGSVANMTKLGQFYFRNLRTYQQCLEDPLAPPGAAYDYWYARETELTILSAIPKQQLDADNNPTSSGSTVSPFVWLGIALGAVVVVGLAATVTTLLVVRARRKRRMREVEVDSLSDAKVDSGNKAGVAAVGPSAPHAPQSATADSLYDEVRRSARHDPPTGLVVKEKIGKGSFGTVYRASWRGAVVAVKVVDGWTDSLGRQRRMSQEVDSGASDALCGTAGTADDMQQVVDSDELVIGKAAAGSTIGCESCHDVSTEALVSLQVSHPNVVHTYKTWMVDASQQAAHIPPLALYSSANDDILSWPPSGQSHASHGTDSTVTPTHCSTPTTPRPNAGSPPPTHLTPPVTLHTIPHTPDSPYHPARRSTDGAVLGAPKDANFCGTDARLGGSVENSALYTSTNTSGMGSASRMGSMIEANTGVAAAGDGGSSSAGGSPATFGAAGPPDLAQNAAAVTAPMPPIVETQVAGSGGEQCSGTASTSCAAVSCWDPVSTAGPRDTDDVIKGMAGGKIGGGPMSTWILMEYCDKGNLQAAIQRGQFHNQDGTPKMIPILCCLSDIAAGMEYLHSNAIIHGDLKPANVLLQSTRSNRRSYCAKVADFGMSRAIGAETLVRSSGGSLQYMPPEVITSGHLSRAADSYSFGVLAWELMSGAQAYGNTRLTTLLYKRVVQKQQLEVPSTCPPAFASMLHACWAQEAQGRPTFEELYCMVNDMVDEERLRKQQNVSNGMG